MNPNYGTRRSYSRQFKFASRAELAKTYLDDGAFLTAAQHLTKLADEIRAVGEARNAAMRGIVS